MSTKKRKTGGKTFNPRDGRIYFVASGVNRLKLAADVHDHLLVAVNEIGGPAELARIEDWIAEGKKVFLDSGVYNLAMEHAKKHNISMDTALGTPPEEIDGFQQLFDRYVSLVQRLESGLWGYIEIDMGGRENKIATRAKLEALGLRPIPVYHPLNDGWDYFDELASHYDRLCFGNIVQADRATRMRLLATMWERHRKYPDLWIHILGLTPNPFMSSYPSNSADSSSWLAAVRWASAMRERAMGASVGAFPVNFRYRYDADANAEDGSHKAVKLSGYWAAMIERNWRNHVQAIEQAGMEIYPHE